MNSITPAQRSRTLSEQAYQILRRSILSGELFPGDRLVEAQLAEKLQISRTPIREAMRQLQRDNLLSQNANGGLYVATLSPADAAQLYDCRMALETLSVKEACDRSDDDLDRVGQWVEKADHCANDNFERLEIDYHFHRAIAETAQNPWLVDLLDRLFARMRLLRVQTTRHNPQVLEIGGEHRRIYQAILKRDRALAVQAISDHLEASKIRVIREVEQLYRPR